MEVLKGDPDSIFVPDPFFSLIANLPHFLQRWRIDLSQFKPIAQYERKTDSTLPFAKLQSILVIPDVFLQGDFIASLFPVLLCFRPNRIDVRILRRDPVVCLTHAR